MEDSRTKNKRIFKNTMYMYGRMLILLLISLYTARVVFNTLGIEDYGTYSVVGSIIVLFSFINRGLNSSTSRYITADIAEGNIEKGRKTFNVCLQAHMLIAAIIILLAETVGLWCVNYILKIPEGREFAANIVYQFSVFSAVLAVMQSPYGATITAYERMDIYSYFTIVEVIMKLAVIYLVQALTGDKLIIYSILLFGTGLISISFYRIYAIRTFEICKFKWQKDKELLINIFKFMTWSTLGQAMVVGTNQGASVLVNVYHSVVANAAMGVSNAITSTVSDFVVNFQTAFRPQITKSYVTKDYDYLQNLMIRASKVSSYLVILFLIPIIFEVENVLTIWLGENYPSLSPAFCRWTLICIYFEAISAPLWMIMYAQTNIKNYQLVTSSVYSLNFFIGWLIFWLGAAAYQIIVVRCFVFFILIFVRLYFTKTIFPQFSLRTWLLQVLCGGLFVMSVSGIITGIASRVIHTSMFLHVCIVTVISIAVTVPLILYIGLSVNERTMLLQFVMKKIKK